MRSRQHGYCRLRNVGDKGASARELGECRERWSTVRRGLCRLRIVDGRGVSVHWCGVWKGVSTTLRRPYSLCNVDGSSAQAIARRKAQFEKFKLPNGAAGHARNIAKLGVLYEQYRRLSAVGRGAGVL